MSEAAEAPCVRCASPLERGDFRCAICGLPTPLPTPEEREAIHETIAQILRCHGCGAAMAYDIKAAAPKCSFCGNVMAVETPEDPVEVAEGFLHFRVDPEQAKAALKKWMGGLGFFRPPDLRNLAVVDKLQPLWWAGWVFDADVAVSWAADSDAGSGRSAWAPHSGAFSLRLENVVVSASRGLTERECVALAPGYNLADGSPQPHDLPGSSVEQFDVQRSAARKTIGAALDNVAAMQAQGRVPGSSVRNLHVAVVPERMRTRRLGFPAYVLAYRYQDKVYRAIVHGQNPELVHGAAPLAWLRIAMIVGGAIAAIALVAVIIAMAT
jgi:hypothetical protein